MSLIAFVISLIFLQLISEPSVSMFNVRKLEKSFNLSLKYTKGNSKSVSTQSLNFKRHRNLWKISSPCKWTKEPWSFSLIYGSKWRNYEKWGQSKKKLHPVWDFKIFQDLDTLVLQWLKNLHHIEITILWYVLICLQY